MTLRTLLKLSVFSSSRSLESTTDTSLYLGAVQRTADYTCLCLCLSSQSLRHLVVQYLGTCLAWVDIAHLEGLKQHLQPSLQCMNIGTSTDCGPCTCPNGNMPKALFDALYPPVRSKKASAPATIMQELSKNFELSHVINFALIYITTPSKALLLSHASKNMSWIFASVMVSVHYSTTNTHY